MIPMHTPSACIALASLAFAYLFSLRQATGKKYRARLATEC